MGEQVRIEVEMDAADHAALHSIARDRALPIAEVAAEAVRAHIESERDWEAAVREGLDDIEAGRTTTHDEHLARAAERRRQWLAARAA